MAGVEGRGRGGSGRPVPAEPRRPVAGTVTDGADERVSTMVADRPEPRAPATRSGRRRNRTTWTRALWISFLAFAVWLVLDAPTLEHNAQVSPVGTRRTVALDILGPIASFSRTVGVSHLVSVGDGVIGRTGNRPGNGAVNAARTVGPPASGGHHPGKGSSTPTTGSATTQPGTTPGSTAPPGPRAGATDPTAADPLRVLVLGDSLGIDLGDTLVNDLANTGVVRATLDGQVGTGLTRPDYYNWPAELQTDLARYDPDVVIVMIGANDGQDFPGPPDVPYGSAAWNATYQDRVTDFMQVAASHGTRVIWVGMPPMENAGLSARMQALDTIYRTSAAAVPGVAYVSSWTVLGTTTGAYTAYLEYHGQDVDVREPDGTHIAPGGAEILSQTVLGTLRDTLHIDLPAT